MKFTVNDFQRNAFVVCKDELEYVRFCKRFWHGGFSVMPKMFRGIWPKILVDVNAYKACCLSHFILVSMAKMLGLDHITIFESDAYPMIECKDNLERTFEKFGVPDDADEISFGNLHFIRDWTNKNSGHKCLVDVDKNGIYGRIKDDLWGSHAVVVFAKGYDTWINNYINPSNVGPDLKLGSDFFNWLTPNCYATARSYFIQVKDVLQYPDMLCDKEWLDDFPEIETL